MADNQFEALCGDIAGCGATLNIVSRDDYAPKIERYINTIKEHIRAKHTVSVFCHFPPIFLTDMVYSSVIWINMFPLKGGLSKTMYHLSI